LETYPIGHPLLGMRWKFLRDIYGGCRDGIQEAVEILTESAENDADLGNEEFQECEESLWCITEL
jgi:hypothetical protein